MDEALPEVTQLLRSWRDGDEAALEQLIPVVYDELRRLARLHMRGERPGHTLDATGLVHEAFFKLSGLERMSFRDRQHFFSMASRVMRRVLVDRAREHLAHKRGGGVRAVTLDRAAEVSVEPSPQLLELDDALRALEAEDPRACKIVEMRHFAGMTIEEVGAVLELSPATVRRDWAFAKAFLQRTMSS